MLDVNTENPVRLTDMPHLSSLDPDCDMKLCKRIQRQGESIHRLFAWINQIAGVCHRALKAFLRIALIIVSIPFCF